MNNLPEEYLLNMKKLLGSEYGEFLSSYEQPPVKGLRFNLWKVREETIQKLCSQWNLEPVAWCPSGYSYADVRPGLSPYHDAGVFYMQEPSAMCVVEEAHIRPEDIVLDLCAAPGGKSSAAAERCQLLVSNEIHPQRARILSSNMERLGFSNVIVCQTSPDRLSDCLTELFDVVLCDAPCSGEGMMRKDETAISEWSVENVGNCIERQKEILTEAAKLVKPGGKLVYSTCTFEPGENEQQIQIFLQEHPDFTCLKQNRIWPHQEHGEGHFCSVLIKNGSDAPAVSGLSSEKQLSRFEQKLAASRIHILRAGIEPGTFFTDKKGRRIYEPSHAEIMSGIFDSCDNGVNIFLPELAMNYLRGDVLRLDPDSDGTVIKGEEGYCGVYFDGYPLGLGKRSGLTVKNHLPKGLRRIC